jgi:Transposase and inactivated derivatives
LRFNILRIGGGDMGRAYRTLLLKYPLEKLPPETVEKIAQLLKIQEEFRRWAWEWAKSGGKAEKPEQRPLKYFAKEFIHAARALEWLKDRVIKRGLRPPLVFDAQLRLNSEKDVGRGVLVDLPRREVRIRKWGGNTIALPLSRKNVEWINERVREGARLVFAAAWVGRSRRSRAVALYVALVFRRDVEQMTPKRLLVLDFNALHNGVAYAVVEEKRALEKGVLRPHIAKIIHMERRAAELDSLCAERGAICRQAAALKSRLWRLLRRWEDEMARKIAQLATQHKAAIIADVPLDESIRQLKEGNYAAEKKAFLNFGRLRSRVRELAEWHGVPYREERLYSTICPLCGAKMEEEPNRRVKCRCGFEANRDEVPIHWAVKRFKELLPSFSNLILAATKSI